MANQEHLEILKEGVEIWNKWREEHHDIEPDLRDADLSGLNLSAVKFHLTMLDYAKLDHAKLVGASLQGANLSYANLAYANLAYAKLNSIYFGTFREVTDVGYNNGITAQHSMTTLTHADLGHVNFLYADLDDVDLSGANLSGADLTYVKLNNADLSDVDLTRAFVGGTDFGAVDLSSVKGLDTIKHRWASTIGIDTICRSKGNIPEVFLKGAGVDDTFITYIRSLVGKAIEYYSCFICYSNRDEAFAKRLYADLQNNNVRCWFAPEDLKIGDKFRHRIDESVRVYDKLLLVLSEASLASSWVGYEVEKALDKEPEGKPNVLFPIRLDRAILTCETDWAKGIRKSRHIGDFEHWKDHDAYQVAFKRLLRDLKAQS